MNDKPHKNLNVWKKALDLITKIYEITKLFPQHEQFGIISQIRRSSLSVASNIAEGAARQTKKEFIQFLHMAQGSLSEMDTQLEVAKRLGYIKSKDYNCLFDTSNEIGKMITGLIKSLKKI